MKRAVVIACLCAAVAIGAENRTSRSPQTKRLSYVPLPVSIATNLVLYCPMDRSGAPVLDYSSNGYTGTAVNATWTSGGYLRGGYTFDGTGDTIVFGNRFQSMTGNFTLALWCKGTTANRHVLAKRGLSTTQWDMYVNSSGFNAFYDGSTSHAGSAGGVTDGNWHHLMVIVNGASSFFFTDGAVAGTFSPSISGTTDILEIGAFRSGASGVWVGQIDEVMIFNRALSTTQCTNLYRRLVSAKTIQ